MLGVEGGGTKTLVAAADLDSSAAHEVRVGGSSLARRSEAEVAAELARGCGLARGEWAAEDCAAVCGGFASAGQHTRVFTGILHGLLPRAQLLVMTDATLAWHAATGGGDGIALIAGTGSVAQGFYQGRTEKTGGEGPGRDPGSGDWIGREAVKAGIVAAPADGVFPALLPGLLRQHADDMLPILRRAAEELAAQLRACAEQLSWREPVGYASGGIFLAVPAMRGWVEQAWGHPVREPRQTAIAAAVAMARAAAH